MVDAALNQASSTHAESIPALTWARALDGDRDSLELCLQLDGDGQVARRHRLAAALALKTLDLDLSGPALTAWRNRLRQVSAHHMMLAEALERTGEVLTRAGIKWLPIKGLDLASRVYPRAEQRPTSDIDLLILGDALDPARAALQSAGWSALHSGSLAERYLREEGYAWQARLPRSVLVEVHYRLWGSVASDVSDAMVLEAKADHELPAGGSRLTLADAYITAATHLWLDPAPRKLGAFRDLAMLARSGSDVASELVAAIVSRAATFDLQLPVLSAAQASASLWHERVCQTVSEQLALGLRRAERRWLKKHSDLPTLLAGSHASMTLARHISRRRTRHGLPRLLWRRLWAHPGIVETATQPGSPWLLRRAVFQARAWGLHRPSTKSSPANISQGPTGL